MKPYLLAELQDHALRLGGLVLSDSYQSCKHLMLWQCKHGHQWETSWDGILHNNSWCPICAKLSKPALDSLQNHAQKRGGILCSTSYQNNWTKMMWQCRQGHQWGAAWQNIQTGKWCPTCAGRVKSLTDIQACASERGGELVSTVYLDDRVSKLEWRCGSGHTWSARWHDVKRGTWCPYCKHKKETLCRSLLETHFGVPFPKKRFRYRETRYEWDGYSAERRLAFEYHGEQHYFQNNFFNRKNQGFQEQQRRDQAKVDYARENGIILLVIPFSQLQTLACLIKEQWGSISDLREFLA